MVAWPEVGCVSIILWRLLWKPRAVLLLRRSWVISVLYFTVAKVWACSCISSWDRSPLDCLRIETGWMLSFCVLSGDYNCWGWNLLLFSSLTLSPSKKDSSFSWSWYSLDFCFFSLLCFFFYLNSCSFSDGKSWTEDGKFSVRIGWSPFRDGSWL